MSKNLKKKYCFLAIFIGLSFFYNMNAEAEQTFENEKIRIIRPRFFSKRKRLELGGKFSIITNQTFIYTYLLSGVLNYHFTESFAMQANASYGISIDKEDKESLETNFDINTLIVRTNSILGINALWTPMYGKYQLQEGTLVYYDTVFLSGLGFTGIEYKYEHCLEPRDANGNIVGTSKSPLIVYYPIFSMGVSQRFFLGKNNSLNWEIRDDILAIDSIDGSCSENVENYTYIQQNILFSIGYSFYF